MLQEIIIEQMVEGQRILKAFIEKIKIKNVKKMKLKIEKNAFKRLK